MLKPLQSGIDPLGQFDMEDDHMTYVNGGEVATLSAWSSGEYAAPDVTTSGPFSGATSYLKLNLSHISAHSVFYGLLDEGTASGTGSQDGYGTMFGSMIGAVAGKGTGFGSASTVGVVAIGPSTLYGSGKASLWVRPGLFGVTLNGWVSGSEFAAVAVNDPVYASSSATLSVKGKLTTTAASNGVAAALAIGLVKDSSLVSTAAATPVNEYVALYLTGVQVAV